MLNPADARIPPPVGSLSDSPETAASTPTTRPPGLGLREIDYCLSWAERPVVVVALLTSGIALGAFAGFRILSDPTAAVIGGFAGGTGTMTLHALGRCAARCVRQERDEEM